LEGPVKSPVKSVDFAQIFGGKIQGALHSGDLSDEAVFCFLTQQSTLLKRGTTGG
jgi:hypothetical protein